MTWSRLDRVDRERTLALVGVLDWFNKEADAFILRMDACLRANQNGGEKDGEIHVYESNACEAKIQGKKRKEGPEARSYLKMPSGQRFRFCFDLAVNLATDSPLIYWECVSCSSKKTDPVTMFLSTSP